MTRYLTVEWVVQYHQQLMESHGQQGGLMGEQGRNKLESALLRPESEAFGVEAHPGIAAKAGVLLQGIVIAHPFTDGNKRIALGAMLSFLELNGAPIEADEDGLYDFVIAVTTGELRDPDAIAEQVRKLFALA